MRIDTVKGCSYVVTCTGACTVQVLRADASPITILEAAKAGQYVFVAPTDAVEVSDEHALVTQNFKAASLRSSAQGGGIGNGENATLNSLSAATVDCSGTATFRELIVSGGLTATGNTTTLGNVITANISVQRVDVAGPASFSYGVTMAQSLTVEGQAIIKTGLNVGEDLSLYGSDGLPGGSLRGFYESPDESTIIIKDAGALEYMAIGYNSNTAQASLNLRGNAASLALPEKLVGPVQFYTQDLNYVLFGITYDAATGWQVGTDFRFNAYGGMDVASGAVFHSGVTMEQSLNVAGEAILKRLAVYGGQYSVFTVETARATWTNAQTGYFRLVSDNKGEKEVVLELGNGQIGNKARFIKPSQSGALTEIDVPNCQEGDARWVKFNNTLTAAQYAALAVKDPTTLYITSDTRKIYFGSYALN